MRRILIGLTLVYVVSRIAAAQAPEMPAGISRAELVNNSSVMVARLTMEPGAREEIHTHPFDAVVVHITPGDVEMTIDDEKTSGPRDAGTVFFIPKDAPHAAVNIGRIPFDIVTVAIK